MNLIDTLTTSLQNFYRKCIETTNENLNLDIRVNKYVSQVIIYRKRQNTFKLYCLLIWVNMILIKSQLIAKSLPVQQDRGFEQCLRNLCWLLETHSASEMLTRQLSRQQEFSLSEEIVLSVRETAWRKANWFLVALFFSLELMIITITINIQWNLDH